MVDNYIPDLIDIEEVLINNLYENDELSLMIYIAPGENEYTVTFEGKFKTNDFKIDATIALEKHATGKHSSHHMNFKTSDNINLLFKGKIHFNFILKSKLELDNALKGFVYAIYNSLDFIENKYTSPNELKRFFFGDLILDWKNNIDDLHMLIERSIRYDKLHLEIENNSLVEFKTKISTVDSNMAIHRKLFHIARIMYDEPFLPPFIFKPVYAQISLLPKIKKLGLNEVEIEQFLISCIKKGENIHQYDQQKFLAEYKKNN